MPWAGSGCFNAVKMSPAGSGESVSAAIACEIPFVFTLQTDNESAQTYPAGLVDTPHMECPAPVSVRKRLWKIGGLLGLLFLAAILTNFFLPRDKVFSHKMFGHDFLPFYTAGQFLRAGRVDQLYDPDATRVLEHATCDHAGLIIHNEYGAFLNPPFAAIPARFLAAWPYETALAIWSVFLAGFLLLAIVILKRLLPGDTPWRVWGLIPLLLFVAMPVWQAALHAQNTFFSLLVLSAAVALWRKQRPLAAGLVMGILFFKPQLAIVPAMLLAITQGRRAILGLASTGALLLLVTLIALPHALGDYLHRMPENLRAIQILPNYTWHRHLTFLAFWRMLVQGHVGALPNPAVRTLAWVCTASVAIAFMRTAWRFRNNRAAADRLIAAGLASMPLMVPYFMDYDLTLLAVPAVLCAADAMRHGVDRRIVIAWSALFLVMEVNPGIAGSTTLIPAVPLLLVLSGLLIAKVHQPQAAAKSSEKVVPSHFAMAA